MPQQKPQADPWEAAVQAYKQGGTPQQANAAPAGNVWQAQDEQPQPLMTQMAQSAKNAGIGAAKGFLHTISSSDDWARQHMPAWMTNSDFGFGPPANLEHVHQMATPHGTAQKIGYGGEQAGEFLIPGGAEESAAEHLGELAPKLKPLARIAASALGAGAVNKAQGGSFAGGAAGGAAAGAAGEGLRAVAPRIAESALNIRKLDRAYGKGGGAIGRTILDETTGLTPGSVAESAQSRLNDLNPQLEQAADRASVRQNRVRGLLPAPTEEIPLHQTAGRPPRARPMAFDAKINPEEDPMEPRSGNPMADISEYPGVNPHYLSGGAHPELAGRMPVTHGVLLRAPEVGTGSIPDVVPHMSASLRTARGVLSSALGTAARQGERTTMNQIDPMVTHLGETIDGQPIGNQITPRQLLDLKRGFGNEFIHRWNPETMTGVKGTAAQTYRAMGDEFNRVVPEARELNGRISRLIPIAKRAESAELNAPTTQRIFQRIAAPTGALTGAVGGGYAGYERGRAEGALAGAGLGLLAPTLLTTPTGQMFLARTLNGWSRPATRALAGGGLQMSARNNAQTTKVPK